MHILFVRPQCNYHIARLLLSSPKHQQVFASGDTSLQSHILSRGAIPALKALVDAGVPVSFTNFQQIDNETDTLNAKVRIMRLVGACDDIKALEFAFSFYGGSQFFWKSPPLVETDNGGFHQQSRQNHQMAHLFEYNSRVCMLAIIGWCGVDTFNFFIDNGFDMTNLLDDDVDEILHRALCTESVSEDRAKRMIIRLAEYPQIRDGIDDSCTMACPRSDGTTHSYDNHFLKALKMYSPACSGLYQLGYRFPPGKEFNLQKYISTQWIDPVWAILLRYPFFEWILSLPPTTTQLNLQQPISIVYNKGDEFDDTSRSLFLPAYSDNLKVSLPIVFIALINSDKAKYILQSLLSAPKQSYPVNLAVQLNIQLVQQDEELFKTNTLSTIGPTNESYPLMSPKPNKCTPLHIAAWGDEGDIPYSIPTPIDFPTVLPILAYVIDCLIDGTFDQIHIPAELTVCVDRVNRCKTR